VNAVIAAATVTAALTATGALAGATTALVLVSGPSPYATCTIGGPGTNYVGAEVEPSVAVNPGRSGNIVGAWQQDRWSNGGAHGLVAGFSSNGGKSWGETPLPFSACADGLAYERASDVWVSAGPDGTVYANAISFDQTTPRNAVTAATSSDGGQTWANVNVLIGDTSSQFFNDKNSITADPARPGVAYAVWDRLVAPNGNPRADLHAFAFTGPGMLSTTTDGGGTWTAPQVIFPTSERNQTIGNQIVVAPDGTLYDFANWIVQPNTFNKERDQIAFVKSTDGGSTWSAPVVVRDMDAASVVDPNTGQLIRTGDIIPEPAIDPTNGTLYVAWQTTDFTGFSQVAMISSTDGGAHWSAPSRINTPTGQPAFTPTIKVADDHTVGITYYDFRSLTAGDTATLPTDYWFKSSKDGFATDSHLAGPFDMLSAPNARGFFVGDYEGLGTSGRAFVPFFAQTNSGDTSNRTDIIATRITP
jgi:hypothetical protein